MPKVTKFPSPQMFKLPSSVVSGIMAETY